MQNAAMRRRRANKAARTTMQNAAMRRRRANKERNPPNDPVNPSRAGGCR
jgi:hypothetical protein